MKKVIALTLAAMLSIAPLQPLAVEAATSSADTIIDKVIDEMLEKKAAGNSTYYNAVMAVRNSIDADSLMFLYSEFLNDKEKSMIQEAVGKEDAEIMEELEKLTPEDITKIKTKLNNVAQTPGIPPATGGGAGGGVEVTPQPQPQQPTLPTVPVVPATVAFKDISKLWTEAQEAVKFMVEKKVLNGKTEGVFAPNDQITRAEFAKTLVILFGLESSTSTSNIFTDIHDKQWFYPYIQIAYEHGIIKGQNSTTFAPDAYISRQEMAVMIARTMKVMNLKDTVLPLQAKEMLAVYQDNGKVADWARTDLALAIKQGILKGKGENSIAPQDNASRAEAVVILKRLFDLINN